MNKTELIKQVANSIEGATQKDVTIVTDMIIETIKEIVETALKSVVHEKKTKSTKSTRGSKKKKDQEVAQVEPIEENNVQPVQESVQPVETAPVNQTAPVENVTPHVEQGKC